ncbi:MAG: hypothetical protein FD180_2520 [Planctomycetota bacterium]|nr:MAG: hypothetical protein FD180_2520 [Planctomycetota bacterium]
MRPSLAVLVFCAAASAIFADEPPSWSEFDVSSANGQWVAQVRRSPRGGGAPAANAWDDDWTLRVYREKDGKPDGEVSWTAPFRHSGYSGGLLSGNGAHFVTVSDWFHLHGAPVTIDSARGPVAHTPHGVDFGVPAAKLKPTASHWLWLGEARPQFDDDWQTLKVTTIEDTKRWVDLDSGRLCGHASGPLRGSLRVDRRVAALGERVQFSFGLLNISGKEAVTWHAGVWANHRVFLVDENDKESPLTAFGKTARNCFGPDRDKNVKWKVPPGSWDDQIKEESLDRHFVVDRPGRYTLKVMYEDVSNGAAVKLVSIPVEIVFFKDSLPSPAEIGDRITDCVAKDHRAGLEPLVEGGKIADEDWEALKKSEAMNSYRFLAEGHFAPKENAVDLGGDAHQMSVKCAKAEGGWRIAKIERSR